MKIGDLVMVHYKDGSISGIVGIYLGEGVYGISPYVEIYINNQIRRLYKLDYIFEVINESRRLG